MTPSFARAVEELERLGQMPPPGRFRTDEMERALAVLARPHEVYARAQVIGTNGKGSAALFLSAILGAHGLKTGLYTSPHLVSFRERIVLDGSAISERAFASLYFSLKPVFIKFRLTQFERLTIMAAEFFRREKVDFAVFETGLGGKGDAVTSFKSPYLLFTTISLEHGDILGKTIRLIAGAKAQPLEYCERAWALEQASRTAADVLRKKAASRGVPLAFVPLPNSAVIARGGTYFVHRAKKYLIPMFGGQYAANAALALEAASGIMGERFSHSKAAAGLSSAVWAGRLQFLHFKGCNSMLVSCAHNDESLEADLAAIRRFMDIGLMPRENVGVLFGVSGSRDTAKFIGKVRRVFCDVTLTAVPGHDAAFERASGEKGISFCRDYRAAVRRVVGPRPENKCFAVVMGSIYLAGAALSLLTGGVVLPVKVSKRGGRRRG